MGTVPLKKEAWIFSLLVRIILPVSLLASLWGCARHEAKVGPPPHPDFAEFPAGLAMAVDQAEAAIAQEPRNPEGWLTLGRLYQANRFDGEARHCYQQIVAADHVGARVSYYLAKLAESASDLAGEMQWLHETLRRDGTYVPARLLLADAQFKSGAPAAAVKGYQAVLTREPGNAEALIGMARERLRVGDETAAGAILEKLTAARPHYSTGFALLAQIVERQGDPDRAAALRERARARKDPPLDDPWMDELLASCFDVQRLGIRFEDWVKAGREAEALTCLHQLERVDPDNWIVCQIRALALAQQGRGDDAVAEYKRALAAGGAAAKIYPGLVAALITLNRDAEAETVVRAGLVLCPDLPALNVGLARLHERRHQPVDAMRILESVLRVAPQDLAANQLLAKLSWTSGDHTRAIRCLEIVRLLAPADVPARATIGHYYLEKNEPTAAIPPLVEAVALESSNADLRGLLALAYVRVGNEEARERRYTAAITSYNHAIATQPDFAEAHVNKAQVCAHAGWYDQAELAMAPLLTLRPQDPALWLKLGDIQHAGQKSAAARQTWQQAAVLLATSPDAQLREAVAMRLGSVPSPSP